MQKENHRPVQSQNEQTSFMNFNGSSIAFENINGVMMINATQMSKPFGQKPVFWLRTQQAKDLLKAYSAVHNCTTADMQVVKSGGLNQGTWLNEDIALLFAQWLSPEFYLACNAKLKEIVANKAR